MPTNCHSISTIVNLWPKYLLLFVYIATHISICITISFSSVKNEYLRIHTFLRI